MFFMTFFQTVAQHAFLNLGKKKIMQEHFRIKYFNKFTNLAKICKKKYPLPALLLKKYKNRIIEMSVCCLEIEFDFFSLPKDAYKCDNFVPQRVFFLFVVHII